MDAKLITKLSIEHMTKRKQIVPIKTMSITILHNTLTNINKTTIKDKNSSCKLSVQQVILQNFNVPKLI